MCVCICGNICVLGKFCGKSGWAHVVIRKNTNRDEGILRLLDLALSCTDTRQEMKVLKALTFLRNKRMDSITITESHIIFLIGQIISLSLVSFPSYPSFMILPEGSLFNINLIMSLLVISRKSDGSPSRQNTIRIPQTQKQGFPQSVSHQPFQFNLLLPPNMQPTLNHKKFACISKRPMLPLASAPSKPALFQLTISYLSFQAHLQQCLLQEVFAKHHHSPPTLMCMCVYTHVHANIHKLLYSQSPQIHA